MFRLRFLDRPFIPRAAMRALTIVFLCSCAAAGPVECVIHVSVDGLRPDAITALGPASAPNFYRMRTEGSWTDNARSDYDVTVTLPCHTTQVTGRGVLGPEGHEWTSNSDPLPGVTLASNKGSYIAGVFDVVHDSGLRTAEYASKYKFLLFATSWNSENGAPDITGEDNGQNKIDWYFNNGFIESGDTEVLVNTLVANMVTQTFNYVFVHLADPDTMGHIAGWDPAPGSDYSNTVKDMDSRLGVIFSLVTTNARLIGRTAIILTSDHGGKGDGHGDPAVPENYTVPFYVWGPGVIAGGPLYTLNPANRLDPGTNRPPYSDPVQPIRNGEAANVALKLLGLPPVPGSTICAAQDLALTIPPPTDLAQHPVEGDMVLTFSSISNVLYDVQARNGLYSGNWIDVVTNIVGTGGVVTCLDVQGASFTQRYYRLRAHF